MDIEDLQLPDATVYLVDIGGEELFDILLNETTWKQDSLRIAGKSVSLPRLTAWYGDPGKVYSYSGIKNTPNPWTPTLLALKHRVEEILQYQFNSALLNLYRDGRDSIGFHSDDEPELGATPVIASLSYGSERTLVFKNKRNEYSDFKILLPAKSMLIMMGDTQKNWKHGILKCNSDESRINITFRSVYELPA